RWCFATATRASRTRRRTPTAPCATSRASAIAPGTWWESCRTPSGSPRRSWGPTRATGYSPHSWRGSMPPDKPSKNEDEYFARQDQEALGKMRQRQAAERRAAERHGHYMKCPKCGGDLHTETFHGV